MDRRKVLVLGGVVLALLGAGLVYFYARSADLRASSRFSAVQVLVAKTQINSGETLSAAEAAGKLELRSVSTDSVVPGAISQVSQIPATDVATGVIYPGEQILPARFATAATTTSQLPIPPGQIAVSLTFDDPSRVAGFVNPGNTVTVFASGQQGTRVLLPKVTVIGIGSTTPLTQTTTDGSGQSTTTQAMPSTLLTFAVPQREAEKLIFEAHNGTLVLALRNGKSTVTADPGVTTSNLFN